MPKTKTKTKKSDPSYLERLAQIRATQSGNYIRTTMLDKRLTEEEEKQVIENCINDLHRTNLIPHNISTERLNIFIMKFDDVLHKMNMLLETQ